MGRGRPSVSGVRQNLVEMLYLMGEGYAYDLYRIYKEIFPSVSMRLIYYHLKRGLSTGEFQIAKIVSEAGDYSWGTKAEKVYYSLGPKAEPVLDPKIRDYLNRK